MTHFLRANMFSGLEARFCQISSNLKISIEMFLLVLLVEALRDSDAISTSSHLNL